MDGLIQSFGVMSDKPGGVGKPVIGFLKQRQQFCVNDIMHVSGQRNGGPSQKPGTAGQKAVHLAFRHKFPVGAAKIVRRNLPNQGKGQGECHSGNQSAHQIISYGNLGSGELGEKYGIILTAVIIVDGGLAVPEIRGRQSGASHHGRHKSEIHEFFFSKCLRPESYNISPQQKRQKQNEFFSQNQIFCRYREKGGNMTALRFGGGMLFL